MFCEECNEKKATIHMTKIIQGKKEEIHLCEDCAKVKDTANFENSFSIHNFLAGLLDVNTDHQFSTQYSETYQCPQCNTTYDRFRQKGRLGCNQCYESFKERLGPLVRKIHGNIRHTGKAPKRTGGIIRLKREVHQLKQQLIEAVHQQAFEKAAELRDQINELENRIEEM
ncbi:Protein-arginine kinase activator protein McsA [Natronincola peptidivorans]|uniref:Protein-arginine kinase activator protein McsA n=1 Tax=Natronincola peptidivorans TaxID=426128 RepID=A0A1I0GR10_9FIRM|nr:UvrB/UvrC motif-containing protein [Natronincola peptidivorans]SET72854.1 Protein-arginine kinase activator protein McsA [Natronincola peptidivorans]